MNQPKPGTYVVDLVRPGNGANVLARCPFCQNAHIHMVPSTAVNPTRLVLTLTCPICNVRDTYAPKT